MTTIRVGLLGVLMSCGLLAAPSTEPKRSPGQREFMRKKLEYSQRILEGLALESYGTIAEQAEKLMAMSQAAAWQLSDQPEYLEFSGTFRREVGALARAARERNLDGATMAFLRATTSCVECHKYVRRSGLIRI